MMASRPNSCPWLLRERADLAPQLAGFERLLDEDRHFVEIERLVDVMVRPQPHRLDGVLHRRERGHQDDQCFGGGFLDALEHAQAVAVRQLEIEEHEVELGAELLQRLAGGSGLENAIAFLVEPLAQRPADQRLVIDDQQGGRGHVVKYTNEDCSCL